MLILQLTRHRAATSCLHVCHGLIDGVVHRVGLGRLAHQHHRIGQRNPCLRHTYLQGGIHRRLNDGDDLRIGQAYVLVGTHQQSAASGRQVTRLQQPRQIVQCRIGIRAAHRLLISRHDVVVIVALAVVAHGTALCQLLCRVQRHRNAAVGSGLPCHHAQFHCIERFTHVTTAGTGDVLAHPLFHRDGVAALLTQEIETAFHRLFDILHIYGLKLKHRGTAEDSIVHVEIGILGSGSNQGDASVLDVLQQSLLLALIEILNLIQIE